MVQILYPVKNIQNKELCEYFRNTVTFEDDGAFNLYDINLTVPKGHLIGIMGRVGSGKSLLLDGILSEIIKVRGTVAVSEVDKGFAYVKQSPWLQRGTIRDNILFGNPYDYNKYKTILKACALTTDLNSLPNKDLTVVGDAGNTLSGGQKTRISLARAIYAEKDIYLLDDVLATLDPKVASYVFEHVILGLLTHKTRLLCTHQTQYLIHADLVVDMSKGRIVNEGQPSEVLPDIDDYLLSSDSYEPNLNIESVNDLPIDVNQFDKNSTDPLPDEEFTEKGTVRLGVYTCYTNAVGRYLVILILISIFLMQSSRNLTDLWLSYWVSRDNTTATNTTERPNLLQLNYLFDDQNISTNYCLTVYAILAVLNSLFTLMRAFMFAYGGIQAAIAIHKQLLKIVVRAKAVFFDIQPLGRIINRFSSDTYTIDDTLPFIANILFAQFFGLLATIVVTTYGLPWILLVLAPLVPVYHWIQNHYRLTSRELKRLSSAALSPLMRAFMFAYGGIQAAFKNCYADKSNHLRLEYFFDDYKRSSSYYLTVCAILIVSNSPFILMKAFAFVPRGTDTAIAILKEL